MARVTRTLWHGALAFEDDDTPPDVRLFNEAGRSTALWLYQSRELYRAGLYLMEERERIWNEITHLLQAPIALMLGAYALETLLKMVIVGAHVNQGGHTRDAHRAEQFLPRTHDLVTLTRQAKLRVNEDDRGLLRDLTRYAVWAGRYPIPLTSDGFAGPALFEAVAPPPTAVAREHPTWPKFKVLYVKLFEQSVRKTFRHREFVLKPAT
jgi:hypothetical protein